MVDRLHKFIKLRDGTMACALCDVKMSDFHATEYCKGPRTLPHPYADARKRVKHLEYELDMLKSGEWHICESPDETETKIVRTGQDHPWRDCSICVPGGH